MSLPTGLELVLSMSTVGALADALHERMSRSPITYDTAAMSSPWLTAQEAADHLRCPLSRVRKLSMTGTIPMHRDGGRFLFRRDEIDQWVKTGGAA